MTVASPEPKSDSAQGDAVQSAPVPGLSDHGDDAERFEALLLAALDDPARLDGLSLREWNGLLRHARLTGLLPRLAVCVRDAAAGDGWPWKVRDAFEAARAVAGHHERCVRWEVNRISRALRGLDVKPILLKGAAYILAGLPPARGRIVSDVDILVPKVKLRAVEQALMDHGWEHIHLDPYDQRYYRQWMHELPPMRHRLRRTVIDVHHTILPESGRLKPDPRKLIKAARPIAGHEEVLMLAPQDMVLHAAAHFFEDGELAGGLRDLMDIRDLLHQFGDTQAGFWEGLMARAKEMDLHRPMSHAMRLAQKLMSARVPVEAAASARALGPVMPIAELMEVLTRRALALEQEGRANTSIHVSRFLLYCRAHYLRMPPLRLAGHLWRKSTRRWFDTQEPEDHQEEG